MNDSYVELIVPRKGNILDVVIKALGVTVTLFLLFLGTMNSILLIAGLACGLLCYFFFPNLNIEFEYLYISKELQIDKIMSKQKRKTVANYQLEKMEVFAAEGSDTLSEYKNRKMEQKDFSSGRKDVKRYHLIINDGEYKRIILEPNDKMIKAIKDQFPRKVHE